MRKKIYRPAHEKPKEMWMDYILLPYGEFYNNTKKFLDAKRGDTLRFYNGPDVIIDKVMIIEDARVCDILSRMRYGLSWDKAFEKWLRYARLEGNGRDVLSSNKCIMITYDAQDTV